MAQSLSCYTIGLNFVTSSNQYFPCGSTSTSGGAQSCCFAGDICMEDGICHYTHHVANGTGYYMGGCTDPTWQHESCPKQCTSEYGADVVYDSKSKDWHCCDSTKDSLNCQQPSNFTVNAPAPDALHTIQHLTQSAPSAILTPIGAITSVATIASNATGTAIPTFSGNSSASTTSSYKTNITITSTAGMNMTRTASLLSSNSKTSSSAMTTSSPIISSSASTTSAAASASSSSAADVIINPMRIGLAALMLAPFAFL